VKLTRSTYPDYPGVQGDPCWRLQGRWLAIDADWNTRPPFGTSFGLHAGRRAPAAGQPDRRPGFLLDLNAPLGEPNRLYLWLGRWHAVLALPEVRDFRDTGPGGRPVIRGEHFSSWRHPHLGTIDRYRYHQDEAGMWRRNAEPEPLHWGWLTLERRIRPH
jgi:hypothetical protein